jgi:hypothetical protein
MKRVIVGILAMLVVLPALEITSGINGASSASALGGLQMLHSQAIMGGMIACAVLYGPERALCRRHPTPPHQAYQRNVEYRLAGQTTGRILRLVLANTTYVAHPDYASVGADKAPASNTTTSAQASSSSKVYRRYLEMQAASHNSWACPAGSTLAAAVSAQQGGAALPAADGVGAGLVVVDAAAAAHAVQAEGDAVVLLQAAGCRHLQSFVLLDIKWSLQAQVRLAGRGHPAHACSGFRV